jgi:hypothetical protein
MMQYQNDQVHFEKNGLHFSSRMIQTKECYICGHAFSEQHRIINGQHGGPYEYWNVVKLCPNHHAALHYTINALFRGTYTTLAENDCRMQAYLKDATFNDFLDIYFDAIYDCYRVMVDTTIPFDRLPEEHQEQIRQRLLDCKVRWSVIMCLD